MVSSVFLFQNCATIIWGTSKKIPVTSNPSGAKIIVDGKEIGNAPLNLKLKKKKKLYTIRIEKQGYNPFEIRIKRKTSGSLAVSILGNAYLGGSAGALIGYGMAYVLFKEKKFGSVGEGFGTILGVISLGILLGWISAIYVDSKLGGIYTLSPKELNITLTKIEGKPQPNLILIDAENFQNIKWIRIRCADSGGEEIVNID
jgi:hypothetical protein